MKENENQIELFEFTKDEEKSILEVTIELTELMCKIVAEGATMNKSDSSNITIIEIIGYIIGEDRKKSMNFAMVSSMERSGEVKISGMISEKSKNFLEHLLTYQLQILEVNIPRAVEFAKQHGNLIEGASTNIYALPFQEAAEEIAL
jgi:hypothetical protein